MTAPAQAIRAYLDAQRDALLGFTAELCGIESHATQPDGVDAVGDRVCHELEALGYVTTRTRGERVPPDRRWLEEVMLRRRQLRFRRTARNPVPRRHGADRR